MQITKRLLAMMVTVALAWVFCVTAYAHDVPDLSKTGSISVTMRHEDDKSAVPGGELTLYRVGDIAEENGNYSYTLTEAFAGSGVTLDNLESAELAKKLADYAKANKLTGTVQKIDSKGVAAASDLTLGLYLVVQTEAAEGYNAVNPFLVTVPVLTDGVYVYEVDANPKVELVTEKEKEPKPTPTPTPGTKLPQTGQLNWPIPLLAGVGLLLFALGWGLRFGKKQKG